MRSAKIMTVCFVVVLTLLALCSSAQAADGMVSYWRFDEGEGTTAYDSVGANDGTLINGPVWTTGQVDGALSFDGVDDYVDTTHDFSWSNTQPFSICLWFKRDSTADDDLFFSKSWFEYTYHTWGNKVTFNYWEEGGWGSLPLIGTTRTVADRWYHTCVTYDGGGASTGIGRIYLDGINEGTGTAPTIQFEDRPLNTQIGYGYKIWGRSEDMDGLIDEVAIWNRALTAEEIQQHYQNGLDGLGYSIEIEIDIKPGSYPNAINLGAKGLIPVAILSSEDFGATSVDPDTVELAGSGVAVRGKGNRFLAHEEDVNGDGLIDLVVQVATANLDPDSFQDGYVVLTGTTYDELPIWGVDEIIIVPTQE